MTDEYRYQRLEAQGLIEARPNDQKNWFLSLADAEHNLEAWRKFYNQVRPH